MNSYIYKCFLSCNSVKINSKNVKKNDIFFGLKGTNFDGGDFAEEAIDKGAKYVVVKKRQSINESNNYIYVDDPLLVLQNIAREHRLKFNIPIIAVTGSSGKTTTKELISLVLSQKYIVHSNKGNFNSHIGVPLTLLSMKKNTEIAVIEMGARAQGEIKALCKIVEPNVGLITNVREVHLDGFTSLEGVLKGKMELYDYLSKNNGSIFINAKEENIVRASSNLSKKTFFLNKNSNECRFIATKIPYVSYIDNENNIINTKILGDFNINNIASAISIGNFFKVNNQAIGQAISSYKSQSNRLQEIKKDHCVILLDAYNSNYLAAKEAIRVLDSYSKRNKMLVLGDMAELGSKSDIYHRKILDIIHKGSYWLSIFCGPKFCKNKKYHPQSLFFETKEELDIYLRENTFSNVDILIKSSRNLKLETIVDLI